MSLFLSSPFSSLVSLSLSTALSLVLAFFLRFCTDSLACVLSSSNAFNSPSFTSVFPSHSMEQSWHDSTITNLERGSRDASCDPRDPTLLHIGPHAHRPRSRVMPGERLGLRQASRTAAARPAPPGHDPRRHGGLARGATGGLRPRRQASVTAQTQPPLAESSRAQSTAWAEPRSAGPEVQQSTAAAAH